jgi:nicotinamidase-related amidase
MLVDASKSSLLIIDVQDKLLPAMADPEGVCQKSRVLITVAEELAMPVTLSEQYPKGLGRTVAELQTRSGVVLEKTAFSCWRDTAARAQFIDLHERGRPQVIVAGIEAHVCCLQTCIDMAQAGFAVYAVADAMSSRKLESAALAFERMRMNGVQVVNTEMMVFELLEHAGTAVFKTLSALIR